MILYDGYMCGCDELRERIHEDHLDGPIESEQTQKGWAKVNEENTDHFSASLSLALQLTHSEQFHLPVSLRDFQRFRMVSLDV